MCILFALLLRSEIECSIVGESVRCRLVNYRTKFAFNSFHLRIVRPAFLLFSLALEARVILFSSLSLVYFIVHSLDFGRFFGFYFP